MKTTKNSQNSSETKSDFFTVADVAKKLGDKSTKTILRRINAGKIIAKWDDGRYLIAPADYYAYVESLPNKRG